MNRLEENVKQRKKQLIFAHRGASFIFPENTMVAFREALHQRADGIEIDVQLTKDGHPIIMHDEKVNRTTNGQGYIKDFTLEEIKRLDAGSWKSKRFAGEKVPTLKELFQWVKETSLYINIELKNNIIEYPLLEEKILELIADFKIEERIIISSFNHQSLAKVHQLQPSMETAILHMESLFEPCYYVKSFGATSLHSYWPLLLPDFMDEMNRESIPVRAFTVNKEKQMKTCLSIGCAAIITDLPDKALQIRESLNR